MPDFCVIIFFVFCFHGQIGFIFAVRSWWGLRACRLRVCNGTRTYE